MTQGSPEVGSLYVVAIQQLFEELDVEAGRVEGIARAGWDNVYVVGPQEVVLKSLLEESYREIWARETKNLVYNFLLGCKEEGAYAR